MILGDELGKYQWRNSFINCKWLNTIYRTRCWYSCRKTYKITYTVITNTLSNDRFLMSGTSSFASTQIPTSIGINTV